MILLDTNVVAALMYLEREPKVRDWVDRQNLQDLFLPTPVVFETSFGIARMPPGRRRQDLEQRYADFLQHIVAGRILVLDTRSAKAAGEIHVEMVRRNRDKEIVDSLLAGMGRGLGACIATRNTKDFAGHGLQLINPWSA